MDTTTLGRTGRTVSVAGFGCGGSSRLGITRGLSTEESVRLVRAAMDEGVSLLDTAEAYGTEEIVGRAVSHVDRNSVTVCTKSRYRNGDTFLSASELVANLEASLRRLDLDSVDVFFVHAVRPADYARVYDEYVPALLREKERGTLQHIGITETPPNDPRQVMMTRAVYEDVWEVVMLGFHLMNHGPRRHIFPTTQANGIGTLIMFAVRAIFSRPERLREAMRALAAAGKVPPEMAERENPLADLVDQSGAKDLTEMAYRFARHEPGADVVLFGTGSEAHMRANVAAINAAPLPESVQARLSALFGRLAGVGFDVPDHMKKPG